MCLDVGEGGGTDCMGALEDMSAKWVVVAGTFRVKVATCEAGGEKEGAG